MSKSAMQKALDALEREQVMAQDNNGDYTINVTPKHITEAIVELRAAIAAQEPAQEATLHDYPILQQFHTKHALGTLAAPSCFCCGKQTSASRLVAVKHLELPGMVICQKCKTASQAVEPEPFCKVQHNGEWFNQQIKSAWIAR
jgi:hypothetical protein